MLHKARFLCMAAAFFVAPLTQATVSSDQQRIDTGREIYLQRCAACHGVQGEGQPDWQQRNALGELPAPPHGPSGHTWKHSDEMLLRIIKNGWRDPFNKTMRITMPAFKKILSDKEIQEVTIYLKTLWTPEQRLFQKEESKGHSFPKANQRYEQGSN